MKNAMIFLCFLLISFNSSYGQWYVNKYQVSDINLLSKTQLEESLANTKQDLAISGSCALVGGCILVLGMYCTPEVNEHSSWVEQLLGEKGMKDVTVAFGALLTVGGIIALNGYLIRKAKIRTAINKNFPKYGSFNLSPDIIRNNYTSSYNLGVLLRYNF